MKILIGLLILSTGAGFVRPVPSSPKYGRRMTASAQVESTTLQAKETLVAFLNTGQDENSPMLEPFLAKLQKTYASSKIDARFSEDPSYNGDWNNINAPAFKGRLGFQDGLPQYTIGTLTFNLIPDVKKMVCSVEKMVQRVHYAEGIPPEHLIPASLRETVKTQPKTLRTNKIDTVFRIPENNVRGVLRMEGYTIPNLGDENKYDTWFIGGLCMNDGSDEATWNTVFGDAKLTYKLGNPMAAYQTVIYLDENLRISVGNRGSVMIVGREWSLTYPKRWILLTIWSLSQNFSF